MQERVIKWEMAMMMAEAEQDSWGGSLMIALFFLIGFLILHRTLRKGWICFESLSCLLSDFVSIFLFFKLPNQEYLQARYLF